MSEGPMDEHALLEGLRAALEDVERVVDDLVRLVVVARYEADHPVAASAPPPTNLTRRRR